MLRRAFRIAYDGRPYHGFQRQPDVTTVEGELFGALRRLGVFEGDKPPGYAAAGRTDAGVSARAQTVALDAPEWLSPSALNGELAPGILAWAGADAPEDFHATHDANWREYRYFWYAPGVADDRAGRALDRLLGEQDFHNLTPDDELTTRDLAGGLARDGDFVVVTVRASGFCRELVRRVVSLVQDVTESGDVDRIDRILSSEPVAGPEGVPPAPAGPLVLHDVDYALEFTVAADAADAVRESFADLYVQRRALGRAASHVADCI